MFLHFIEEYCAQLTNRMTGSVNRTVSSYFSELFWGLLISLNGSIKLSTPIKEVVKI